MNFITAKIFDDPIQANLFCALLENEGIDCFVEDENLITTDRLFSNAIGGIKVKILEKDLNSLKELLQKTSETKVTDESGEILTCPNCASDEIIPDYKSMKSVRGLIAAFLSMLFLVYPVFYELKRKCKHCNLEFNNS